MTELIWLWLDRITILTAALAAILSGMIWIKSRRHIALNRWAEEKRRTPIVIRLVDGRRTIDLPYCPRRDQLSRQELTGLLSFYFGESRFDPVIVRRVLESGDLSRVLAGAVTKADAVAERDDVLTVEVDQDFLDQVMKGMESRSDGVISASSLNAMSSASPVGHNVPMATRIWNLTPHAMHYDDGQVLRTIESDGMLRLEQEDRPAEPIEGMRVVRTQYGKPGGLPEGIAAGDVLIVSTLVGDSWNVKERPPGVKVIVPDTGSTCKRDSSGRIVSVSRFIHK